MGARVECSETHGVIAFDWGRCELRAGDGVLIVRAETVDVEAMRMLRSASAPGLSSSATATA